MPHCEIIFHAVPEGPPYYANSPMRAVGRCITHGIEVGPPYTKENKLCAIGKIEAATELAINMIENAKSQ